MRKIIKAIKHEKFIPIFSPQPNTPLEVKGAKKQMPQSRKALKLEKE